ncbi:PREDICTED: zinc finger protein 593-like [Priapulus caudatus]|uniref:Zinc finger protein 593-like n=1 Tax=Priapulus caudatus TaxID=37621 RepID=A0ABM1F1G1_PRICU|nr:PREDICTED: zinc finger protein 593-like [Priapulus caudatus]
MGTPAGRRKKKAGQKGSSHLTKIMKTKRKTKDHDQIHDDLVPCVADKMLNQDVDHDKPGAAQHYCITCARYFQDEKALKEHFRTKPHKRRIKALQTEPYSQKEADAAAGMGSYHLRQKVDVKTQALKSDQAAKMDETETT